MKLKKMFEDKFGPWEIFSDVFTVFFYREMLYVILPLIIVLVVRTIIKGGGIINFLEFISSSLFSFAIVIIFAFNIPCFIELKRKQKDLSNQLIDGVKRNILFLIVSVIVLSIAIIFEEKCLITTKISTATTKIPTAQIIKETLAVFNLILFIVGIFYIFRLQYFEKYLEYKKNHIDVLKSFNGFSASLRESIEKSYEELVYFLYFLEGFTIDIKVDKKISPKDFFSSAIYNGKELEVVEDYLRRAKEKIDLAEKKFHERKKVLFQVYKTTDMEQDMETPEEK